MTRPPRHRMSRRGFCLCCLSASAVGLLTPRQAFAEARRIVQLIQSEAATTPIAIHRVRDDFAVLEGSGGNVAVFTGSGGKLLVDGGIAVSRPQVATALAAVGDGQVTHLVNTHWHFDHANGNEWLHTLGPDIIAHENTRKRLATTERVADWDFDFPPLSGGALPTVLFDERKTLTVNGERVELAYYGPAHTDSDISVHFSGMNILHTGDTFWNGNYPFIDYSTGGNIDGSIRAADANLAATDDATVIGRGTGSRFQIGRSSRNSAICWWRSGRTSRR